MTDHLKGGRLSPRDAQVLGNLAIGKRTHRDPSETEIRERIKKLRTELDIHRLPSPERLQLLERLVGCQDELIVYFAKKAME